ncbi:Retrovirus-related Pol polyprotein from transposon 17.6 [Stylophora pistillata]|uniref:Retrovirus-related Pol polyprotein from transposon 17.6 n=1 Tax=Stylophora pistillata TaxID=50429 RepID=A0A2B4SMJ2_STYPI|nr:Retrovirus-related Pol polyprotein from transposon 17.6 [Stylophora pistillata]
MELLDNYFAPQLNVPLERHQFRQMEQASGESVNHFVCRLRQKAISCEFENVDEAMRNQLIEKCRDPSLRSKFLEKENATPKDLQNLACVQEAVNMQKDPIEVIGTFVSEIVYEISGISCVDEFTLVKGPGRPLLGKNTGEKLGVLRVGPDVCSLTAEGSDADIRKKYREVLTRFKKLKDFQLKLHIKDDFKPVAQPVRRLPFGSRAKVDEKLNDHELLAKDIIEESRQGVTPSEEKVAAISKAGPPQDVSQVRSFVQLVQYSAKFLPNFAQESEPLRSLMRKNEPFIWGEAQERNLTEVERRYSETEKEALALVWACKRFNIYVCGQKFELETDHKPLECIFGRLSKPSARIERWVLRLQGYDYKVVYRPGKANIADSPSRLNQCERKDSSGEEFDFVKAVTEESLPVALTAKQVELASDSDPDLASLRQYILSGDWSQCNMIDYVCVKDKLELKTKLPELRCAGNLLDEGISDRDWNHKLIQKKHVDNKRGAAESPVAPGDLVLLKNAETSGKLEANFESEPYTVQTKEGSEVTVRSKEGVEHRRNSALVKRYNPPGELPEATETISQDTSNTLPLEENIVTSRRRRTVRMQEKHKNYVLYELNSVVTLDLC